MESGPKWRRTAVVYSASNCFAEAIYSSANESRLLAEWDQNARGVRIVMGIYSQFSIVVFWTTHPESSSAVENFDNCNLPRTFKMNLFHNKRPRDGPICRKSQFPGISS